jgi:hypothetical protein
MTDGKRLLQSGIVFCLYAFVLIIGSRLVPLHWVFAAFVVGVACHELGHLMFAAIGSIPIRLIVVGQGPGSTAAIPTTFASRPVHPRLPTTLSRRSTRPPWANCCHHRPLRTHGNLV